VTTRLRFTAALALTLALAALLAAPALAAPAEPAAQTATPLVTKLRAANLGATVLARGDRQALYYWTRERDGKIRCVGACAKAWPPYIVAKGRAVPKKIKGFSGTFGVVVRPDGRRQLTYDKLPLYVYAHEGRGIVLCDDVDGWFAIRL
jgi:predicted lipoprotein with Yx(FWY)xxD motif